MWVEVLPHILNITEMSNRIAILHLHRAVNIDYRKQNYRIFKTSPFIRSFLTGIWWMADRCY